MKSSKEKLVACRDWNEKIHLTPVSEMSFRPSAYGVIIEDDKILLSPQRNGYDFPGGGMELHETIEECLLREVSEETGITVDMGDLIAIDNDFFYNLNNNETWNTILMFYRCINPRGTISTDGFGEDEKAYVRKAEWINIADIEHLKFHNPVDSFAIIRKALSFT